MQLRALAVRASFCLLATTLGGALVGCSIRNNDRYCDADENADDDDCEPRPAADPKTPAPAPTSPGGAVANTMCDSFCDRLVTCGTIRAASVASCRADCQAGLLADPVGTRNGCACVERDACRPLSDYTCPGAPLPRDDGGPAQGSGGTSGGGAGAGGAAGVTCTANCQCDEGEACQGGTCVANTPPPPQCATDCECLKGQRCLAGACE